MPNEFKVPYVTGQNLYGLLLNPAAQIFNGSAFESANGAHLSTYVIALTELASLGLYVGSIPSLISAGTYFFAVRLRQGSTPAGSDPFLGGASIRWNGSAEIFPASPGDPMDLVSAPNPAAVADIASASSPAGAGPIAINHNTGGTDNLRYVDSTGTGISGASILIYNASDWPANSMHVQAAATTGPDGRWLDPAFVAHGTYIAIFTKLGSDGPDISAPFTV